MLNSVPEPREYLTDTRSRETRVAQTPAKHALTMSPIKCQILTQALVQAYGFESLEFQDHWWGEPVRVYESDMVHIHVHYNEFQSPDDPLYDVEWDADIEDWEDRYKPLLIDIPYQIEVRCFVNRRVYVYEFDHDDNLYLVTMIQL